MSVLRNQLPAPLYTAEQTRVLDKTAITQFGIPGIRLMQRAGHAVFAEIVERFPHVDALTVFCGAGNNGGDGFVIAGLALRRGMQVQLICMGNKDFPEKLQGEARLAWDELAQQQPRWQLYDSETEISGELIVDAMLGTGLSGAVRGDFAAAIRLINAAGRPVFAVDTPSGLCADSGRVLGDAICADLTMSFIGLKRGLLTGEAVDYVGTLLFDDLKIPDEVYDQVPVNVFRTSDEDLRELLPRRDRSAHKGCFGHVLVVGGNAGMGGAGLLAAEAAIRSGAGLVSLATHPQHVTAALTRCPEVMVKGVQSGAELTPLLAKADVIVLGPGLGQNAWADQMLMAALAAKKPMVVDADALNLLVQKNKFTELDARHWIFTPHPGEAARMLGCTVAELARDRFATVKQLQQLTGGTVVLKGAGSLVSSGEVIHLCDAGNPGMAVGGMGDVLSGIGGACLAQGLVTEDAARIAVYIHAKAADKVVEKQGEIGLLASDLCKQIPSVVNNKDD